MLSRWCHRVIGVRQIPRKHGTQRTLPALANIAIAWLLFTMGSGCASETSLPLVSNTPPPIRSESRKDNGSDRNPQASTCVAFGDFHLKGAAGEGHTAIQKDQILDQARKAYQQALKLDPKYVPAYRGLAQTYEQLGDHDRVVAAYQSGLKANPAEPSLWFELGMYHARKKQWQPAVENLKKASELDSENRTYGDMLAYTLARAGRYDESYECFKKGVGEARAHYNVARMLCHMKENDLAREHLKLALKANPDLAPARQVLAELDAGTRSKPTVAVSFDDTDATEPQGGGRE
jgi:tetratricopeptide (TPR) repeat protein